MQTNKLSCSKHILMNGGKSLLIKPRGNLQRLNKTLGKQSVISHSMQR